MRLLKFLTESNAIKAGIKVPAADSTKEYTEDEVKQAIDKLISAIKEAKGAKSDAAVAAERDFMAKLRQWIKLANDRFPDSLKNEKSAAKSVLQGKAPEKNAAPVTPETPMPVKLAVKTGMLPGNEEEE